MSDWEDQFSRWASPPGKTEQDRYENAEKAIRNAIQRAKRLNRRNIRVFTHGSYRNNTNVRKDSDVDIGIVCSDVFFPDYPHGTTGETLGHLPADYTYAAYKDEIEQALVSYFGRASVTRGNKAFNIREKSYHVEADAVPFFEHRRYERNGTYLLGVELRPDSGIPHRVINWPEQHYKNGVNKNKATGRDFKSLVRILKSLCNQMSEEKIPSALPIPGFLIECLIWNVPNDHFDHTSYTADVRACLAFLFNNTRRDKDCSEWGEVSELKYLFRRAQRWTRARAHSYLSAAWDYVGFE